MVTIPLEVEAEASEASRRKLRTTNFTESSTYIILLCPSKLPGATVLQIESRCGALLTDSKIEAKVGVLGTNTNFSANGFRRSESQVSCIRLQGQSAETRVLRHPSTICKFVHTQFW
jgi:hypothetical protein